MGTSSIIGIDVGYRQVKAMTSESKTVFPSSVAPAKSFAVESIGKIEDHLVKIKYTNQSKKEYFVGNLAEREAAGSLITQNDRVKHTDVSHSILILTATRLLAEDWLTDTFKPQKLVVGLPISYYKSQKDELRKSLLSLGAHVEVDKLRQIKIQYEDVMVFPQGSGALLTVKNLPDNGTVCLVDIGMKTTDCVVARIEDGIMIPVASLCISVELGVKDFYDSVAGYYENKTGSSPGFLRILEVVERGGKVTYERKPIDLSTEIELSRNEIKEAIVDRVKNSLAEIWSELDRVYVSGGGSVVFDSIAGQMGAERIDEPVWANAAGFLKAGISSEK